MGTARGDGDSALESLPWSSRLVACGRFFTDGTLLRSNPRLSALIVDRVGEVRLPDLVVAGQRGAGEQYWQSVESYLRAKSDFLIHGVCPECAAKLSADIGEGRDDE